MAATQPTALEHTIKTEDEVENMDRPVLAVNPSRKHVRSSSIDLEIDWDNNTCDGGASNCVKVEESSGEYMHPSPASFLKYLSGQNNIGSLHPDADALRFHLKQAIIMKEHLVTENLRLVAELRRTRRELHNLRDVMDCAGQKLQEQAGRRFRGIDSDSASEDNLEESTSDNEA
ncbi:hypothetical protein B0H16DRAFT_1461331 [Mycena metata]|uniref:Uncharacterized protein n=1 Tax=Mycena metata TaxID=1033252 RepID=A0AAD7IT55_9AGAR|nr:hypothetical protein B0H16DRAFT_1461331 [Mycena metata]